MALRRIGPVDGNDKTYNGEMALVRGYGVTRGVGEGGVTAITVAGSRGVGIVSESAPLGPVNITRRGDVVAIAGAAGIPQQTYVKFDATGRVVPVTGTPGSGEEVIGRTESAPILVGDEVIVFVNPFVL